MVLGNHGRDVATVVFTPIAKVLAKLGVTPNMVTLTSAVLVAIAGAALIAPGHLVAGAILLTLLLLADSLDGVLARETGVASPFGAFLDSTIDRITDGIAFGSVVWWAVFNLSPSAPRTAIVTAGLLTMIFAATVPYARARAESIGVDASVGIAERTDRLVVVGVGVFLTGLGLSPWFVAAAFIWVAFASAVTVGQRILATARAVDQPVEK